ncbi:MAG: hypothetical protein QHH15_00440 [Candidatus Thermoplasmatota archaeon]|nr:hypothetical protein [Candidatus Thermoplasmatota archaeon]MDH7506242.1 hypothetical protein [Candidatus Thermoplasmatota archaeon]
MIQMFIKHRILVEINFDHLTVGFNPLPTVILFLFLVYGDNCMGSNLNNFKKPSKECFTRLVIIQKEEVKRIVEKCEECKKYGFKMEWDHKIIYENYKEGKYNLEEKVIPRKKLKEGIVGDDNIKLFKYVKKRGNNWILKGGII